MTESTRAIVIGGGHNGLICAALLAKAGHAVTLLEGRSSIANAPDLEFAPGFFSPGLAHIHTELHPKLRQALNLTSKSTGTKTKTIALDGQGAHIHFYGDKVEGTSVSDVDQAAYASFRKEFLSYAKALTPLLLNRPPRLKNMDRGDQFTLAKLGWSLRFGLGASSMREFFRVGGINIYDVLNELFENKLVKAAISVDAVMGHHMAPRTPTTVLTYLTRLFAETHSEPSVATKVDSLHRELEASAIAAGVDIKTDAWVEKVIIENDRANGVQLASGQTMLADIVASSADAKNTFLKLAGAANLDAMFVHRISKTRTNGSVARLHLALKDTPSFTNLTTEDLKGRLLIAPDMRYIERAFNPTKYGEHAEQPVLEITIPSLHDATMAPDGQHVMSVNICYAPYHLKQGWDNARDKFTQICIDTLSAYAPNLPSQIIQKELLTPQDIETRFNISGGHWHHGELAIDQSFMMRPIHGTAQYNTPIENLFLCGAAAHPGGGITGLPGWNAARRIIAMTKDKSS